MGNAGFISSIVLMLPRILTEPLNTNLYRGCHKGTYSRTCVNQASAVAVWIEDHPVFGFLGWVFGVGLVFNSKKTYKG